MTDNKDKYFKSQEFLDTLKRYENTISIGKAEYFESDELSNIAEYYYDEGKKQQALNVLDYAIRLHPGATMPLVFRGRMALIDQKNVSEAKVFADQITDRFDLDCIYLQAEIMIAEDRVDDADNFLQHNIHAIDEDDIPDYVLDVATLFIDYNLPDRAAYWLNQSDEADLQDYREVKARIAFAKGDYQQSEQIFEQLLDEDPYSGYYWNSLASTQLMSNRINDSITSSEYSIAINPNDHEAILNKANGLFSLGNFAEAKDYYERFWRLCPDEGCAPLFIGNCFMNMSKSEEALTHYEIAQTLMRQQGINSPDLLQCMAFTLSQLDRVDEALHYVDEALACSDANKNDVKVVRGHILLEHGRAKEAIKSFLDALHNSSFSHDVFFKIAISVYDCGYPTIAYRMFKAYTDVHHNKGDEGMAYLASCCLLTGKHEEFLKCLKAACATNPEETRKVLGENYPVGMNPADYYSYELTKHK